MKTSGKKYLSLDNRTILVTGSPGFIGAGLVYNLLHHVQGGTIISLDNMNDYYDVSLKEYRLKLLEEAAAHSASEHIFVKGSIADRDFLDAIFKKYEPTIVVNLAAQAGVRHSIDNPQKYIESNIIGFFNILEACRNMMQSNPVEHLVFASSSSVYGKNTKVPFSTKDKTDSPVSLYAATKKSNELLAHSYSELYKIPITALRFFTVYGPAGRPDMFYFSTADKLRNDEMISVYNYGDQHRDFTYVDDVTEGIIRVMQGAPIDPAFEVYNIGKGTPVNLKEFINILHEELTAAGVLAPDFDLEAHIKYIEMQPGDVPLTYADTTDLERDYGYKPLTDLRTGLRRFAQWYSKYCKENENQKQGQYRKLK